LSASEVREARLLAIASVDHGALARLASTVCARAETRDVLALADCLPFAPAGTPEHDVRGRTIPVTSDAVLIPLVARTVRAGGSGTEIDALGGRVHDRAALGRAVSIYFFFFKTGFHISFSSFVERSLTFQHFSCNRAADDPEVERLAVLVPPAVTRWAEAGASRSAASADWRDRGAVLASIRSARALAARALRWLPATATESGEVRAASDTLASLETELNQ
jgi:hypothetical protein